MDTIGQSVAAKADDQHHILPYPDMATRPKMTELQCAQPVSFNFPFSHFALMYINRNGELQLESSPSISGCEKGIFTEDVKEKFMRSAAVGWQPTMQSGPLGHMHGDITGKSQPFLANPNPGAGGWYQQQSSLIPCEWQSFQNKRHRRSLRRAGSAYGPDSDSISPTPSLRWSALRVGHRELLRTYYDKAFENFQQLNCRAIAKAFVKLVEPRKQVNHPYNGRKTAAGTSQKVDPELTKPKWWPAGVTHREPDHLLKADRIRLLVHILCELRESHGITAGKLREAGQDVRRQIVPAERSQVLDEIYYVREMEELFLEGKISGDTIIHVSHVHMGEACIDSELRAQVADGSFCEASLTGFPAKRDASNMAESHYPGVGGEVHPSAFDRRHHTLTGSYQPTNEHDGQAPLSPTSSPTISRKSSLESSLTTYSNDINPSMITSSEQDRSLCAPKDINPSTTCIPGYFTQQMTAPTAAGGPHASQGFWNPLPPTHQPLAFQGY